MREKTELAERHDGVPKNWPEWRASKRNAHEWHALEWCVLVRTSVLQACHLAAELAVNAHTVR